MPTPDSELPEIDVAKIYVMLKQLRDDTLDGVKGVSARVANLERVTIELRQSVNGMASEYADTRVKRLEEEAEEAERERTLIREQLKAVDEKIEKKKASSISALTTSEKIKSAVTISREQAEEHRRKERDIAWRNRWNSVLTAVMVSIAVPIGLAIAYAVIQFLANVFNVTIPGG